MTAKVILKPYANRWTALKRRPESEEALNTAGIDYELVVSEYAGHGIEMAAQAYKDGFNPIIAAGGDSTYNEIANGLVLAAGENPVESAFAILPMGTANDLADNLGIPKEPQDAAQVIAVGNTRCSVHSDGEVFDFAIKVLEYKIHPGRIPILLPKSDG
jgi:diacylglycerol kinase family enzyme